MGSRIGGNRETVTVSSVKLNFNQEVGRVRTVRRLLLFQELFDNFGDDSVCYRTSASNQGDTIKSASRWMFSFYSKLLAIEFPFP